VSLFRRWKALPGEHKHYVLIYTTVVLWCIAYFIFFPESMVLFADRIYFLFWMIPVVVGAVVAIKGMLSHDNLLLERLGVSLVMIAPIAYALLQAGVAVGLFVTPSPGEDVTGRIPLIILAFWLFLTLRNRSRELNEQLDSAKNLPLANEPPIETI